MKKFIFKFLIAGFIIPIVFILLIFIDDKFHISYQFSSTILSIQIILWPPSILFLAGFDIIVALVATILNIILYGILGLLIWIGIYKRKTVLLITVFCLIISWCIFIPMLLTGKGL